jgi:hypothetical protein
MAGHAVGSASKILAARNKSGIVIETLRAREWSG